MDLAHGDAAETQATYGVVSMSVAKNPSVLCLEKMATALLGGHVRV
jgi:hypothetical protein